MTEKLRDLGYFILNSAKSPLYAGIITFLIIFAGGFGSLFSKEIRTAFPFSLGPYDGLSGHAIVFWILIVIASFTFFLRQWAADDASSEARKELIRQIQTLPPADFLALFAKVYDSCEVVFRQTKEVDNITPLKEATRFILRGITTLAQRFDPRGQDIFYAANIMVFKKADDLDKKESDEIAKRLKFCEKECAVSKFNGVLDLQVDLSTTIDNEDREPDSSLRAFALPVPTPHTVEVVGGRKLYRVLPGAPLAFIERRLDIYADTSELLDWCNKKGSFSEYVKPLCANISETLPNP